MSDFRVLLKPLRQDGRVSRPTAEALEARADGAGALAEVLSPRQHRTLVAVAGRLVPQDGPDIVDLAAAIEQELASGKGDGWRYDALPSDRDAYRAGLATLDAAARTRGVECFAALTHDGQDAILGEAAAGGLVTPAQAECLSPAQMKLWFEEVLADCTRAYVSHPATQARIGYLGFANGGDALPLTGFRALEAGALEPWEVAARDRRLA